jgi:hypothetical protein
LPRKSSAARSVFVNSTAAKPAVTVSVVQITAPNGAVLAGGLQSTAVINPDITNPDITNPDITNPDITNPDITNPDITNPDITSAEVYNPTVTNPDITNPDIASAQITNPDITNPDITNPDITNPDITSMVVVNPDITNPDITNPDITNPDITNPDITNPDIAGVPAGGMTDYTWKLTNKGNTTASYNAKLFLKQSQCCPAGCPGGANCPVSCNKCQLVLRRTYPTPIANGCTLAVETQNSPIASVPNPSFANASNAGTPDTSSDPTNATVSLGPGEGGRVTLRVFGVTVPPTSPAPVKPIGVSSGANTGQSAPATSLTLTTTELPTAVVGAAYSATLQSVGGTGASRLWTLLTGVLPSNLNLNSASGQITGPVTASTGAYGFIAQVQDSPPAPTAPHLDNTALTLQVSQLRITSVTAVNSTTGTTWLRAGQSATVTVTIQNLGNVTATSVNASALSVSSTGPTITCGPASPAGATILGGAHQAFTYACGLVGSGPDGSITFGGQASGLYVNSSAAVAASTGVVTSNAIVVDTTPPVMAVSLRAPIPTLPEPGPIRT